MKWLMIGLGTLLSAVAVAGGFAAFRRRRIEKDTDEVDGGVVKRYWADAPKSILSADIVTFHCEISLFAACETDGLGNRVYTLDAVRKDGEVLVKYDWYERNGKGDKASYKADDGFMTRLQEIVTAYDFAQYNGYYHNVSGLPAMYGEKLTIVYDSGESISIHDNQSRVLPLEAEKALVTLFGAATQQNNK